MKKLILISIFSLSSNIAYSGCLEDLVARGVNSCSSNRQVGSILNCVNSMEASIQYCKQALEQKKQAQVDRKDKIIADEVQKIKTSSDHVLSASITNKQNARYIALKKLSEDFTEYSDSMKSAIAKTNSVYNELKKLNFKVDSESDKNNKIDQLEKISKRISNESKNAQAYFNEFKPRFISSEVVLDINLTESALMPVKNLKKQNDQIISLIKETIDSLKTVSSVTVPSQINFPVLLEELVREGHNQKNLIDSCDKNESNDCLLKISVNDQYQKEIAARVASAKLRIVGMTNIELKKVIVSAQEKNDLIEFARLFDLAIAAGNIK